MNRMIWSLLLCLVGFSGVLAQPEVVPQPAVLPRDVPRLLQVLRDGKDEERQQAALLLGDLHDTRAVEPLIVVLQDQDLTVAMNAISALGQLQDVRAVEPLLAVLHAGKPQLLGGAVLALTTFRDPRVLPALLMAAGDADPEVRASVITFLPRIHGEAVAPRLLAALADQETRVRVAAANATSQAAASQLDTRPWQPAVAPLIKMLADPDPAVRQPAITALGFLGDPAALEPLLAQVKTADQTTMSVLLQALSTFRDARVAEAVVALPLDEHGRLPVDAGTALFRLGRTAAPAVVAALENKADPARRTAMAQAAASLRDSRVTRALVALVRQQEDPALRVIAVQALRNRYDARTRETMVAALHSTDPALRRAALDAIHPIFYPEALQPVLQAMTDPDKGVAMAAARKLATFDDPRALEALLPLLASEDKGVRKQALEWLTWKTDPRLLEPMLAATREADPALRKLGLRGLSPHWQQATPADRERILAAMTTLLKDADGQVRQETVSTLGWLGDTRVLEPLITTLRTDAKPEAREYAARALGRLGDDRAVEPLIAATRDPVEWARSAAKDELGALGDTRAIPALQALLAVENAQDRWRTTRALNRLGVQDAGQGQPREETALLLDAWFQGGSGREHALQELKTPAHLERVLAMLQQPKAEEGLVQRAIEVLGELKEPRAVEPLLALLETLDSSPAYGTGALVLRALGAIRDPRTIPLLLQALQSPTLRRYGDDHLRVEIINWLSSFNDLRVTTALQQLIAGEESLEVQCAAAGALAARGDNTATTFLLDAEKTAEDRGQPLVLRALGKTGDPRALEMLLARLDGDRYAYTGAIGGLTIFLTLNTDPAVYQRVAARLLAVAAKQDKDWALVELLTPLAQRQDPRALPLLRRCLVGYDYEVWQPALALIGKYRNAEAVDILLEVLQNGPLDAREKAAELLGAQADPRAVPALIAALQHDTTRVRVKAAQALGTLKDPRAREALTAAAQENGTRVKQAAAQALEQMQ